MKIKNIVNQIDEFKFLIEKMQILSQSGMLFLSNQTFSTDKNILQKEYDFIEKAMLFLTENNKSQIQIVEQALMQLQNISGTLVNIEKNTVLDEIELFEIKKNALLSEQIRKLNKIQDWILLPDLSNVIRILDPENTQIPTFYIYEAYDENLAHLRAILRTQEENIDPKIYQQMTDLEDNIKQKLSLEIRHYCADLQQAMHQLAYLDVLIAKAKLAKEMNFCKPQIVDKETSFTQLFNPQLKTILEQSGKYFQPIDICFGDYPTLITGINMGGKTVVLRTLALVQYLCQFGFYLPASSAQVALVDEIFLSIDDSQNRLQGLSSFAAEMKIVDTILQTIEHRKVLVLIDELARTTNPAEGRVIVSALLSIFAEKNVKSFITTHYDNIVASCKRLKVKGLLPSIKSVDMQSITKCIDYTLVEDKSGEVPLEALHIAELLGVNNDLIDKAKKLLKY